MGHTELVRDARAQGSVLPVDLMDRPRATATRRAPAVDRGLMRIGVISNTRAGRRGPHVDRVVSFLKNHSDVPRFETDNSGSVHGALADLARREVNVLVVNGGDGTLQRTLSELLGKGAFERLPLIVPLRSGRTNMSALDIGSHRDPVAAVAAVMESNRAGTMKERVVNRPVLRVKMQPEGTTHYGMFFGAGVIHRAIEFTHRAFPEGRAQGAFGAGLVTGLLVARAVIGSSRDLLTPDHARIRLDRRGEHQGDYLLLIASTLGRMFANIRPFWGDENGPIHYTSIASGAIRGPRVASRIIRGKLPLTNPEDSGLVSRNVETLEFRVNCGLTVDGELFEAKDRTVTVEADRRICFIET